VASSAIDTSIMMNGHLVKPLSELSVDDFGTVLDAFILVDIEKYLRRIKSMKSRSGKQLIKTTAMS